MDLVSNSEALLNHGKKRADLKREYTPPHLDKLGDLRSVTLGGSIGPNESGAPFAQGDPFPTLPSP